MSDLAHDTSLPLDQRTELLRDIQWQAANLLEEIAPKIPDKAPLLWRDRKDIDEDPYVFARRVYAECADLISKNDIERLDKTLLNRMNLRDKELGKPDPDLYSPTKRERNAKLVTGVTWSQILEAAPENVRQMLRAYQTRASRPSRSRTP